MAADMARYLWNFNIVIVSVNFRVSIGVSAVVADREVEGSAASASYVLGLYHTGHKSAVGGERVDVDGVGRSVRGLSVVQGPVSNTARCPTPLHSGHLLMSGPLISR